MPREALKAFDLKAIGIAWALLTACGGDKPTSAPEDSLLMASESATFENVARLGPHRFQATTTRESPEGEYKTTEEVRMAWADWDNFQLQRYRNERLRAENRVLHGKAYAKSGNGRFRQARDAELYRVEMRHSASSWGQVLEPFTGRVLVQSEENAMFNGRPAQRYTLSLEEAPNPSKGHIPLALNGEMWIDETTAIRLYGRLSGRYLKNGDKRKETLIALELNRTEIGIVPVIERPSEVRRSRF